jgi:excisionase family DNA binding protein
MATPDIEGIRTLDASAIFTVGETARLLGISHNGVLMRIKRGQIRFGKSGGRYFIAGAEIQKSIKLPEQYDV